MNARYDRRAGFTLVEVMIAIGIMTVGSLGILAMHSAVSDQGRLASREPSVPRGLAISDRSR